MANLFYGKSAYARERGNMPELPVINMFVEPSPSSPDSVVLQSRAPLVEDAEAGAGPVHGVFQSDGVLDGDTFAVSGSALYRGAVLIGSIDGTGPVRFAASDSELLVCRGAGLWSYNGFNLVRVTYPDDVNVKWVAYLAGYFFAGYGDTGQFQFSAIEDGRTWDGLDFATAENEPDAILDAQVVNDVLVLIGPRTVEFWPKTGDSTIPVAPTEGRTYQCGVKATGASCLFDNTFSFVGETGLVYVGGNIPIRISDAGIEERIAASTSWALFSFFFEGAEYLALRLSQGTWIYSAATQQWSEFQSYGRGNWRAQCATMVGGAPLFGDDASGTLWRFGSGYVDAGGVLERRFRAAAPVSGSASINNIRLTVNVGETPNLTGQYADPVAEIRSSNDQGRTWTGWRSSPLGAQGNYRQRVEWRRLGLFDDPGAVFEFRCTDPVPFRVAGVMANEPGGGRSR